MFDDVHTDYTALLACLADKVLPGYYGPISDAIVTILIVMMPITSRLLTRLF